MNISSMDLNIVLHEARLHVEYEAQRAKVLLMLDNLAHGRANRNEALALLHELGYFEVKELKSKLAAYELVHPAARAQQAKRADSEGDLLL